MLEANSPSRIQLLTFLSGSWPFPIHLFTSPHRVCKKHLIDIFLFLWNFEKQWVFVFWKFKSGWVCIFESSRVVGSVFLKVWKWRWVCGSRFWGFCCCSAACWQAGRRRVKSSARNKAACTQLYKIYKNLMEKYKIQNRNYRISRKRAIGTKLCVAQLHRCCCL